MVSLPSVSMRIATLLLIASSCDGFSLGARLAVHRPLARNAATATMDSGAESTPEELLLEAIGFLKGNEIERARSNVLEARRRCDRNGGPTDEQSQLLDLLTARLPPPKAKDPEPTLAEMFPGTTAAPTGDSLVLPGTPSMADLAAKAKEKRDAMNARDPTEASEP